MMEAENCKILLILYIVLTKALADEFPCQHPLPGLSKVLQGFDITKLELLPHKLNEEDGYRSPVVMFTCKLGKTIILKEKTYDLPDQIWVISRHSRGVYENTATLYKTSSDSLRQTAARMDVDVFDGAFRASANYLYYQNVIDQYSNYVVEMNATELVYLMEMKPSQNLTVDAYYKNAFASLPKNLTAGIEAYQKVINKFGTHFFNKATFGGTVMMRIETSLKYHMKHTDEEIIGEASSKFGNFLQSEGFVSNKAATVSKEFKESSKESVQYYGGSGGRTLQKWQEELDKSPWLLYGRVNPNWELITNETIRENMKLVILFRKDKLLLEDLKRILQKQYSYILPTFQSKIDELLSKSFFDHSSVEKLKQDIKKAIAEESTIPTWFEKINFCYSWVCAKTVSSERCITPGVDVTEDYNKPEVDCSFRWKLSLESPPKWLEHFKMCTNWCPTERCYASDSSSICFRVGDVTDKCQNNVCQEEVKIPSNVPSWAKSSYICIRLNSAVIGKSVRCEWVNKYNNVKTQTDDINGGRSLSSSVVLIITFIFTLSGWL